MADTGAPWNIPFAEPSNLVRDWPGLSEDVAEAVAAGLTAAGPAGTGPNVVQARRTTSFSVDSGYTDWTDVEITFTPSSATSKVLLILVAPNVRHDISGNGTFGVQILAGTTVISDDSRGTAGFDGRNSSTICLLHSPNTTSPVTYKAQVARLVGGSHTFFSGTLTAIEVAA